MLFRSFKGIYVQLEALFRPFQGKKWQYARLFRIPPKEVLINLLSKRLYARLTGI